MPGRKLLKAVVLLSTLLTLTACQPIRPETEASHAGVRTLPHRPYSAKYDGIFVQTVEEVLNEGRSLLHVSYPVTEHEAVNLRMEGLAQSFIEDYRATAAAMEVSYQERSKEDSKEALSFVTRFSQSFEVKAANEEIILFSVERMMNAGGAETVEVDGFIFDRRSGAELAVPDLFADSHYLERLSELSRRELWKRTVLRLTEQSFASDSDRMEALEKSVRWIEEGTAPAAEFFDNILFQTDGTLLVKFDEDQVGSGEDGPVEVALSIGAFSDLLRPEFHQLLSPQLDDAEGAQEIALAGAAETPAAVTVTGPSEDEIDCSVVACVALTFDDGPSIYTESLLDILLSFNVKATFFVLGKSARIQPDTVLRMHREGHQVENHSWNHSNMTTLSDDVIRDQIERTNALIKQITGQESTLFRPPYGAYNEHLLAVTNMPFILWSVDPRDWRDRNAGIVVARVATAPAGAIILAHDIFRSTVDAMPTILSALQSRGVQFVSINKLLEPHIPISGHTYWRQSNPPTD